MKFERTHSILNIKSKKELSEYAEKIIREQGSVDKLNVDKSRLSGFIRKIGAGYLNNPYHNYQHAVDTLYFMAWMLSLPSFKKNLPDFHKYILLLAALCHDVGHPGHDNQWEVKTHSTLAQRYKNNSVIENHSLTITRELLAQSKYDVLPDIKEYSREDAFDLLDQLILCTDFSWHKVFLDELMEGLARNNGSYSDPNYLSLIARTLIKSADISNTSKPFEQARAWGERVMDEFWAQGEMEKKLKLPVGPLNDPENTEFNSTQAGFIKFAALDLFELLAKVESKAQVLVKELGVNQQEYEQAAAAVSASLKQ
jgi:3',5'-cyclic-nucleotide phosphodiesterase